MRLKGDDLSADKDIYDSKFIHRQYHGVNQKGEIEYEKECNTMPVKKNKETQPQDV